MSNIIQAMTRGNNYTKIMTLFYNYLEKHLYPEQLEKKLDSLYQEVITYDSKVFPIKGYSITKPDSVAEIIEALPYRRKIIDIIDSLPSIAKRNLKDDIREVRKAVWMGSYLGRLQYFTGWYSMIDNKPIEIREKLQKKIFKSGCCLESCLDFVEDKGNLLGGVPFTRKTIEDIIADNAITLLVHNEKYSILRVEDVRAIKAIGCNSLWCFTYGDNNYKQWEEYSYNDMVYVIVDWRMKDNPIEFMHLLISPLFENGKQVILCEQDYPLYDMANENFYCPYSVLDNIFGVGDDYIGTIRKYLTFEYN